MKIKKSKLKDLHELGFELINDEAYYKHRQDENKYIINPYRELILNTDDSKDGRIDDTILQLLRGGFIQEEEEKLDIRSGFNIKFDDVFDVIEKAKIGLWSWVGNSRCKYINLRIDTRDMMCNLYDRDNQEITIEELEYQYKSDLGGSDE